MTDGSTSGMVTQLARLMAVLAFLIGYTVVAFAGLTLQSAQAGVTPVWPPSGIALAVTYWLGLRYSLLVLPAMLFLGWAIGVPMPVAALAGIGSVLEAIIGVWLLRRSHVDPSLMHLRDSLLFVALAAVLAPLISALTGATAMTLFTPGPVDWLLIVPMWWLGNSLGVLVVGGLGLVLPGPKTFPTHRFHWAELGVFALAVLAVTWLGIERVNTVASALIMYLLVPLIVVAGLRAGQFGVLVLSAVALFSIMLGHDRLPNESLGIQGLGLLYLDIALVWMATFTGLIVGSARQEKRRRDEVSWLASHDPLTSLVNRGELQIRLRRALHTAQRQRRVHAVLAVDLDRFKRINDSEGHAAGDTVLREISRLLQAEVRARDTVARTGGDEFALLLESCPLVEACGIAENIRRSLEGYVYHGVHGDYGVEASLGVVEIDASVTDAGAALHGADLACYEAKRAGRNRVWVGAVVKAPEAGAAG